MERFLKGNLRLLTQKSPQTADLIRAPVTGSKYSSTWSRSGPVTVARNFADGSSRNLHSAYDPVQEAARFVDSCLTHGRSNFLVTGLGLGYHLLELVRKAPPSSRIVVIEKDPELVRLALTHNDFSSAINHPGVSLHVGIVPSDLAGILEPDRSDWAINGYTLLDFKPLVDMDKEYYYSIQENLKQIYQNSRVDLSTQAAFSKRFYENIFSNGPHWLDSPGVRSLEHSMRGIPAIVVSAGPSLDKNISLLKSSSGRVLIIAVATALQPLLQSGVHPDFVVAVDPDESSLKSLKIDSLPEDLWLLYDPCVPPGVPEQFSSGRRLAMDSKIPLAQWLRDQNEPKGTLGAVSSVAHSAFYFAGYLGCDPVILVGQDLSFNGHRLHCSGSFYNQANQDAIGPGKTLEVLEKNKYNGYGPSLTPVLDMFNGAAQTTTAMDTYKSQFAKGVWGDAATFNATEGGVPIPGTENISLKEALNAFCKQDIGAVKNGAIRGMARPRRKGSLRTALRMQCDRFSNIAARLKTLRARHLNRSNECADKNGFVRDMEDCCRDLLSDPETLRLIQGYQFADFIEWNRRNHRISRAGSTRSADSILEEKFQRDRDFLDVLTEGADSLNSGFKTWIRRMT